MLWFVLAFLILVLIVVRHIPVIRILVALVAIGVALSWIPVVDGPVSGSERQNHQIAKLRWWILDAMVSYRSDHDGAYPEKFSQLFPDYLPSDRVTLFFDEHASDFKSQCKKATADPTEVDRSGLFDCVAGKIPGLLVASKKPFIGICLINGNIRKQFIRVILEINQQASTESEQDFQRRLKGDFSQIEKVRMGLDALNYGIWHSFSRKSKQYAAMRDAKMAKALQLYAECSQIKDPKTEKEILYFISSLRSDWVENEDNDDLLRLIQTNIQDEKMRANVMKSLGIAEKSMSGNAGDALTEKSP